MKHTSIIETWREADKQLFGNQPFVLKHRLVESGLFSESTLAEVIEKVPRSHYNLNTMGYDHENPEWKEGEIHGHSGEQVIETIRRGRMWLNLQSLEKVDPRYKELLDSIFAEFSEQIDGFDSYKRSLGVLISSPKVRVFYHADIPGQSLWQIQGKKRIKIYPSSEPFLKPENMEKIVLGVTEEDMPFEPWYDDYARVYDLGPGDMAHWPLNGPHQVVNEDCLNISVTTAYWTREVRNSFVVNYANGVLRQSFGYRPRATKPTAVSLYPKAALTLLWKKLNLQKGKEADTTVRFRLDPESPTGISPVS